MLNGWSLGTGTLDFFTLREMYRLRRLTPVQLIGALYQRIEAAACPNVWISLVEQKQALARARELETLAHARGSEAFPLYGIPFAVKDNIDIAGMTTTAACHDFAYEATTTSPVVQKLLDAGAILIGKTNLDQFATGLTGLLSSYGSTYNPFNKDYISGGSSSGSAVAVAAGMVAFALGTDTAGSGRVPAAFNHLVGLKPTRGLVSARGVVPACKSLDCLSFLTLNVADAGELLALTKGFDPHDPYSRPAARDFDPEILTTPMSRFRFGVPPRAQLEFYGDSAAESLYNRALDRLEKLGGQRVPIDAAPFLETGKLLYQGPWIAERLLSMDAFHTQHPQAFHPVTLEVLNRGRKPLGLEVFKALHELADLRRRAEEQWALMDVMVLPTAGRIFTTQEAATDPAATSAQLGRYTNFVNLLDLAAVALPAGFTPPPGAQAGPGNELPWGISLIAPAFSEGNLLALGQRFFPDACGGIQGALHPQGPAPEVQGSDPPAATRANRTVICVVGAHLSGQPLNYQLTELGAELLRPAKTAPRYRLFALSGTKPPKPGLVRVEQTSGTKGPGVAIEVELWSVPDKHVATFLTRVPPPLCLGNIYLDNGELVKGFLCEPCALDAATDISHFGGWRAYLSGGI